MTTLKYFFNGIEDADFIQEEINNVNKNLFPFVDTNTSQLAADQIKIEVRMLLQKLATARALNEILRKNLDDNP